MVLNSPKFIYYVGADFIRNKKAIGSLVLKAASITIIVGVLKYFSETDAKLLDTEWISASLPVILYFAPLIFGVFLAIYLVSYPISRFVYLNYHLDRSQIALESRADALKHYSRWDDWDFELNFSD